MNRIYISGSMRKDPNHREKFAAVAKKLRALGYIIVSPVEVDDVCGPPQDGIRGYMRRDVDLIGSCDTLYAMKGWQESDGANVEMALAKCYKLGIVYE